MLVFSLTVTAYAAWPSFRTTLTTTVLSPFPSTDSFMTVAANQLANNYGGGIDAPSVIDDNWHIAYTLYNGGCSLVQLAALVAGYHVISPTPAVWNVQLDATADNVPRCLRLF